MPVTPPTIVIPGITASVLRDHYELPPAAVWSAVRKKRYERITLHPRDQRYELVEPARVMSGSPFSLIYEDLIEELRDGLSEEQDGPAPVFPFGYDWRLPLDHVEAALAHFVQEVIDRTMLMPHYRDSDYAAAPTVNLVGHSMGGLIIAGYLERHTGGLVNKVVTLASPFQGSYEAVLKVATGTADLGDDSGKARERRMARMTPSLYHLLPSFEGALTVDESTLTVDDEAFVADLFDHRAWQPNVARTIERQVRDWEMSGSAFFAEMLEMARTHRERISSLDLSEDGCGVRENDWLAVAGVDEETRVGLRVGPDDDGLPRFVLSSRERRNEWGTDAGESLDTGDGTVPLAGAVAPFLGRSRLVCVTPGDFGYWEIRDRALSVLAGFHGFVPKMNMLHRLVLRFLLDADDLYGNTWGRRVPGVERWTPPLPLREKDAPA